MAYAAAMSLTDEKYVLFTTFRRDGTAVPTPVWVVSLDDDRLGFWTSSGSGKAKRLTHTSKVTVQACNARGVVKTGSAPIPATATLVTGSDFEAIRTKVKAKYGFQTQITKVLGSIGGLLKGKKMPYGDRGVIITLSS